MERGCWGSNRLSLLAPSAAATQARIREPHAPIPEAQGKMALVSLQLQCAPGKKPWTRIARVRRGGGRQKTAATGLAGSTRLWKVGDRSARGVGWGAVGLDKKRQAERTGLNNQGWALASPGDLVFTHLGSAIASWTLPPLLCEASPACLCSATGVRAGYHPRLVSCLLIPGPARERLEKTEIRRGGLWAWRRRGRSGEAGTRSAGGITRPLLAGAARPRSGGAPLQVSDRLWSFIGRS